MQRVFLFLASLAAAFCGSGELRAQQDLLRMERIQLGEATCVLVEDTGSYRLEKLFRAKTEMYTGTLDASGIERLRTLLANSQLKKLSQDGVRVPLITDTVDELQFAIWRDRGWQELTFPSPDSRKPFKEFLDPMLRWFVDTQKQRPSAVRVEGSPTRCMPKPVTHLTVTVTTPSEAPRPPAATPGHYLFRTHSTHYYRARVESACTIVFADGRYHWERSNQMYGADRKDKVGDGQLGSEAIQQLKELLDSQALKDSPENPDVNSGQRMLEGMTTELRFHGKGKYRISSS
jgi:hypothetical protein